MIGLGIGGDPPVHLPLFFAALCAFPALARADLTAAEFLHSHNNPRLKVMMESYLKGVADGFLRYSAGSTLRSRREHIDDVPLFCVPGKLAITLEQDIDILRKYLEENPNHGSDSVGAVLLHARIDTFPCRP